MRCIYPFLFLFGLTACALSPQVVVVNPDLEVAQDAVSARPLSISVEVVDTRSSPVIGQRGGQYPETSDISTDENMTATLQRKVADALVSMGYKNAKKGEIADIVLSVRVINIQYIATVEKSVLKNIETKVSIKALGIKKGKEFTGEYNAVRKKDFIKSPTEQENEDMLNSMFALVLESMLKDKDLLMFIDG